MKTPNSSTSLFSSASAWAPPLCGLFGLALGGLYLRFVNPQNRVRVHQVQVKLAAVERTKNEPRLLVCGDSSVAFGMDPVALKEASGLTAVNLGYAAGDGALALLGVADAAAEAGDTLVLSFVPGLVAKTIHPEREGRLLAMIYGQPSLSMGGRPPLLPFGVTEHLRTYLSAVSPGARLLVNDLGRAALRLPGFRYEKCEIDDGGYFTGKVFLPHETCGEMEPVSLEWKRLLKKFVDRMHGRGVRVFFAMPWFDCAEERAAHVRQQTEVFLAGIGEVMPVLREADLGIKIDHTLFADTDVHLTVDGARRRSRMLGELVRGRMTNDE